MRISCQKMENQMEKNMDNRNWTCIGAYIGMLTNIVILDTEMKNGTDMTLDNKDPHYNNESMNLIIMITITTNNGVLTAILQMNVQTKIILRIGLNSSNNHDHHNNNENCSRDV